MLSEISKSTIISNSYFIILHNFSRDEKQNAQFSRAKDNGLRIDYEDNRIQGDTCRQYIR